MAPLRQLSSCILSWLQNLSSLSQQKLGAGRHMRAIHSGLGIGGKYPPTLLSKVKRVKAPPSTPIFCRAQSPEGLDSPALYFGLSEVCLIFMNCKVSLDLFHYTVLYQQSRRGKEERMTLSSPRLPSQPQCIVPHLPAAYKNQFIKSLWR